MILEISAVSFPTQVFWYKFQAVWLLPMAATITCFILQFAGLDRWLNLRTYALLFLVPVLYVAGDRDQHLPSPRVDGIRD